MKTFISVLFALGLALQGLYAEEVKTVLQPEWIANPYSLCPRSALCAVGEGPSLIRAELSARAALGRIFRTKIESTFKVSEFSDNKSSTPDSQIIEEIKEKTDIELSSVEIIKYFEDEMTFYALAKLNKMKAARVLHDEILKIDEEMKDLAQQLGTGALAKLERSFKEREQLHFRYKFLTNTEIRPPVSYEDILKLKRKIALTYLIDLNIIQDDVEKKLALDSVLRQVLANHSFRVVPKDRIQKDATHKLEVRSFEKELYLQIRGFVRYRFSYSFISTNIKTGKSDSQTFEIVKVGRNYDQAREKSRSELLKVLNEEFDKINFL